MISCNTTPTTKLKVEKVLALPSYPSGSTLEFYNNQLYLTGDDATKLLILDVDYNIVDSVNLFKHDSLRISKNEKADLEASVALTYNKQNYLMLVGSASLSTREKVFVLPLNDTSVKTVKEISVSSFMQKLLASGLKQINIEGAATIDNFLVLANRGNLNDSQNHLVVTALKFWNDGAPLHVAKMILPPMEKFAGVSGLSYVASKDILFFTSSTELTENNYDDGEIGKSYIGFVKNFSKKIKEDTIEVYGFMDLAESDKIFLQEKIESVCVSRSQGNLHTLHLVSDNDNGVSKLFNVTLEME